MAISLINPDGLFAPDTYSQVAVATGTKIVYLAGQVALDEQGNIVGPGDLAAQAEQAYRNVAIALRGSGATFADVAKLTVYVVDWRPDKMEQLVAGAMRVAADFGFDPRRPITLIGVAALGEPEFLIEVEAVAVVE
ncbi:MAG TPA: RidA family protein [Roseiflexaceae bacterium]|nr:RidA family protein [Roseiflexaceae bacterium]